MTTFAIGDQVWWARFQSQERWEPCPDCCGSKVLTVSMGDGSQHVIACSLCAVAYDPPRGVIRVDTTAPDVRLVTLDGRCESPGHVEYRYGCYIMKPDEIFRDKAAAETRAQELGVAWAAEQRTRLLAKVKDGRTWAWHVRYHREAIRHAEQAISRHREQLAYAVERAKP